MLTFSIENRVKYLDELDTIPIVSTFYSGPLRFIAGVIQVVVGTIFSGLSIVFGWVGGCKSWKRKININVTEVYYGIGNLVRGQVAAVPFAGNAMIYLYEKIFGATYYLRRDSEDFLIFPNHPELKDYRGVKTKHIYRCSENFFIDTKNRAIPRGWIYDAPKSS